MKKDIYYAILHVLTVITSIIFVTQTIGFNLPLAFFCCGIGTLLFLVSTKGQLPIITGISGSYIAGIIAVSTQYGISYAVGGTLIAGIIYLVMSVLVQKYPSIMKLFPKYILSLAVVMIALNLLPIGVNIVSLSPSTGLITLIAVFLFSRIKSLKTFAFPLSIAVGTTYHALLYGLTPLNIQTNLEFTFPQFNIYSFTLIGSVAFAILFECLGDCRLMADTVNKPLKEHEVIRGNGLAILFSGLVGSAPITSYTESVAFLRETKHIKVRSTIIAALLLIALAFIPQLTMWIAYIPQAVFGAILVYLFATVLCNSFTMMEIHTPRQSQVLVIALAVYFVSPVVLPSVSPIAVAIVSATIMNKVLK